MADDRSPCLCCGGTGWHESECGARAFCQRCDGTGGVQPAIDVGYLSLPAEVQADVERHAAVKRGGSLNPTPDCGYVPRKPEAATEVWWCEAHREFHEPAGTAIQTGTLCRDNGPQGDGDGPAEA
jgi:hypothetical protein